MRKLTLRLPTLVPSLTFLAVAALTGAALSGGCGSGGGQSNPPLPHVVITVLSQFVDVGQRFFLDAGESTDPNGDSADMTYQWRVTTELGIGVAFDDHCKTDFDEICETNSDDPCSDNPEQFCNNNTDCGAFGFCETNKGTTSPQCTTGICNIGLGDENVKATFVAETAGPFTVRLTAFGSESNGIGTKILDTFPSLYVVGSLFGFGGTQGAALGEVADVNEYATDPIKGAANTLGGNLVLIDHALGVLRVFSLKTGHILGSFGDADRFVNDPAALTFQPGSNRLYVAQADGKVLIFNSPNGLLITTFGNVGPNPASMAFAPEGGSLLVVNGVAGSGVRVFDVDGNFVGVLGDTATAVGKPIDVDFLGDPATALLVSDQTGGVVRCDLDGTNCGPFGEVSGLLANGSPSALAVNPSSDYTDNDVLISDPVGHRVIACDDAGENCGTFGDTANLDSEYRDVFFAPASAPTTTTTETSTTTTTLK